MKDYSDLEKVMNLKHEYHFGKLEKKDLASNPFEQFGRWLEEAVAAKVAKPNAMTLSTASLKGVPSSRVVLLKGFNEKGFIFYTNYSSPKAKDLEANPQAALLFFWPEQEREIRIIGRVEKTTRDESEKYFRTRSEESKLVSFISEQSQLVSSREALEKKIEALRKKFQGQEIPLPPFWGGCRLIPDEFEFWQGRQNRLNDRFQYTKKSGRWVIERLQP